MELIANDRLYAIGQFRTQGGSSADFNTREELNALLAEWKKDMPELHGRFDLDNNGTLDMQEWMLARSAAKREIGKRMREAQAEPDLHIISQPRDGKLFLISNLEQSDLSRRYHFWAWANFIIFIGALSAIAWLLLRNSACLCLWIVIDCINFGNQQIGACDAVHYNSVYRQIGMRNFVRYSECRYTFVE